MFSIREIIAQADLRQRSALDRGAIAVEYAFLLVLVFLAALTAVALFGTGVVDLYTDSSNRFQAATTAP